MAALNAFWNQIIYAILNIRFFDIVDIAVIAYIVYQTIKFLRDSRAWQLVKGLFILLAAYLVANWFELATLRWLLTIVGESLLVVAVIIFQPELRRVLENVGRSNLRKIGKNQMIDSERENMEKCIGSICKAVNNMHENRIGALIVFERETPLGEIINTGTVIDAAISDELVQNVFYPKSPLHDGGMVVRGDRIMSAGCILPLTANRDLNSQLGTRHRAAIGMSEVSDAVVIIVSEETGTISAAVGGMLKRHLAPQTLERLLVNELCPDNAQEQRDLVVRLRQKLKKKEKRNEK